MGVPSQLGPGTPKIDPSKVFIGIILFQIKLTEVSNVSFLKTGSHKTKHICTFRYIHLFASWQVMIHLSGLNLDKTPLYLQISLSDEQLKMIKGVTQELSVLQEQQKKLDQLQKLEDLSRGNAAGRGPPRQQGLDMISSYNQYDDEV